ncbi:homogentisate 12-dioxygenase [Fibrella aestuarina BUZ 2]|uniref:Homogentisate 12-dioxygenase n=1 Tax=Fibrella aestuarina BUZ 2 TaxID=1166018 RepID=I0KC34_9BACT|nr:homogentisate 1,2-dioxygenase [Fibrella aestuarina]CCH01687.1 homogentisate 12-dioxygenase [Fibrella aestuarina BUZ 2]
MPLYHRLGTLPPKRHTIFKSPEGAYYYEQLFGTVGFDGMSSLLYHLHRPTQVKAVLDTVDLRPQLAVEHNIQSRKLIGFDVPPADDFLQSRTPLLVNNDVVVGVAAPRQSLTDYFYKNADADELLFVHRGSGTLRTLLGNIPFVPGDYVLIPRGMIYQIQFTPMGNETGNAADNRLFYLESTSPIYTPKRYRNWFGQQLEHSPYCERDFRLPQDLETHDETGDFVIKIKKEGILHTLVYATHPFDVVGWDGYNFPYALSIHDFEPITGRIHQPPPVHQTFETKACVICSFVPRLFDYHPQAIPAPYNHSNIDSDEVLYYVDGNFMSRNGIGPGVLTLHPGGIPHGPHPGAMERSIGKTGTDELAVMVDTFRPLRLTTQAMGIDDGIYFQSWTEE